MMPQWLDTLDTYVKIMKGAYRNSDGNAKDAAIAAYPVMAASVATLNDALVQVRAEAFGEPSEWEREFDEAVERGEELAVALDKQLRKMEQLTPEQRDQRAK